MIISRAPLRFSFFGGGTDFPEYFLKEGGAVLATAIDKYSLVTASTFQSNLFDYAVRVSYRQNESVTTIDQLGHPVFRECLRLLKFERDIELHTVADLPAFTGLGSSSSFTVSLLKALHAFSGQEIAPLQLAYEAIHVERHILGESVGCQDQTTAAVGGFNLIEFKTESDITVTPLALSSARLAEVQSHIFVVFTGQKRRAAEIESKKVKTFSQHKGTLRDMQRMAHQGAALLQGSGTLEKFGHLLHGAWLAKRSLSMAVSNPEIDEIYRLGLEGGAWGGKLMGAGGGGFVIFLAPPERHPQLRQLLAPRFVLDCRVNAPGAQVIFAEKGGSP